MVINKTPKAGLIKGIAYHIRGTLALNLAKSDTEAISDLSQAIQMLKDTNSFYLQVAYDTRADVYVKLKKYTEALNDHTAIINLNRSTSAFDYHDRAKVYFLKGDYQSTISDCTQAINISSDAKNKQAPYSGFYELRADAYEKTGRTDLANADRQKAAEIKNKFFDSGSIVKSEIKDNSQAEQKLSANHGKKSYKVLFSVGVWQHNKISASEINGLAATEFSGQLISKLKEKKLTVLNQNTGDMNEEEDSQYLGGLNSRSDEKALRILPVALLVEVTFESLEDLPQYQELFVSKVTGRIEIIDTDNNKTIGEERFDQVRGFGNTQEQARRNALRSAAEGISESFLSLIKEKAR
jgi:tetratricopeptide (TPR) repeat protein